MRIHDARELGERLTRLVSDRQVEAAYGLLSPLLTGRISFRLLDAIGAQVGNEPSQAANLFLDRVADQRTMGGWVVIASALRQQFSHDLPGTFDRCRTFVTAADVWDEKEHAQEIRKRRLYNLPRVGIGEDQAQQRHKLSWEDD